MDTLEVISFFHDKKEHYPISDEFIENYQQYDDGRDFSYITYAHRTDHMIDPQMHEPNQKWHLYESYMIYKIIEARGNTDFRIRAFKCPELLLWMAEAAGVESSIVEEAAGYAKFRIDEIRKDTKDKSYSSEAVKYMNDQFKSKYNETLWTKIINKIKDSR